MKYYNENDGKIYDTVEELKAAEGKRVEAENAKKLKAEQKEARWKEVQEAYKKYCDLIDKYNKDYGNGDDSFNVDDFLSLFKYALS